MVRKVKARINHNHRRSGRQTARELNISVEQMQHILKNRLGLKALQFQKGQDPTPDQKKMRVKRAEELRRLHADGQLPNIVSSDEAPFVTEQHVNKQNDRVYLR